MNKPIDYSQYSNVVWQEENWLNPTTNQWMIKIPEGMYLKGDLFGDTNDAKPPQLVHINHSFFMAATATTLCEFDAMCRELDMPLVSDEGWGREDMPAINTNFYMALLYTVWLSNKEGLPGHWKVNWKITDESKAKSWSNVTWDIERLENGSGYDLPTEEQWEYAARVKNVEGNLQFGAKVRFGNSEDIARTSQINFDGSNVDGIPYAENTGDPSIDFRKRTIPVGSLKPSDAGLFNMSGNTWEWTRTEYQG